MSITKPRTTQKTIYEIAKESLASYYDIVVKSHKYVKREIDRRLNFDRIIYYNDNYDAITVTKTADAYVINVTKGYTTISIITRKPRHAYTRLLNLYNALIIGFKHKNMKYNYVNLTIDEVANAYLFTALVTRDNVPLYSIQVSGSLNPRRIYQVVLSSTDKTYELFKKMFGKSRAVVTPKIIPEFVELVNYEYEKQLNKRKRAG